MANELRIAVENGDWNSVAELITPEECYSLGATNQAGLLYVASQNGNLKVVEALIAATPGLVNWIALDPPARYRVPLHAACENGHLEVVEALLAANTNLYDGDSHSIFTPLQLASQNGHLKVVNALIKAGVSVDTKSKTGATAISIAAKNNHEDIVDALIKAGSVRLHSFYNSEFSATFFQETTLIGELKSKEPEAFNEFMRMRG